MGRQLKKSMVFAAMIVGLAAASARAEDVLRVKISFRSSSEARRSQRANMTFMHGRPGIRGGLNHWHQWHEGSGNRSHHHSLRAQSRRPRPDAHVRPTRERDSTRGDMGDGRLRARNSTTLNCD